MGRGVPIGDKGMYSYTIAQWLFFFYFYCFFGWCFESSYVSIKKRHFVNRGFMRGPFLPLYGTGAIMMLVVSMPFRDNLFLTYLAGCVGATVLEYVTGVVMEALFKVRYWDYSNQKFNFQGHICLGSSLAWGGLTILMTEVIHKPVEKLVFMMPSMALSAVTFLLTCYIVSDFTLSFKAALDLRDILVKMEKAKEELQHLQKRLDVLIAISENEREERRQEREEKRQEREMRVDELRESIEERLEAFRVKVQEKPAAYMENAREELADIIVKYRMNLQQNRLFKYAKNAYRRSQLLGNPGMVSKKFKEALEELKAAAEHKEKDE